MRRRARHGVDDEARHRRHELGRQDRMAHPPAGHRVGLREAVEDDRALRHARQRRDRDVLALVDDPAVDLVGQDRDVAVAGDIGDADEVLAREHAARRVCRRVEDDQLRPRRHQADELVRVETEVVLLADRDRYRRSANEARHRLVDRKARVRVDDLVALLRQGEDREEHDRLRPGRHDHLGRVDGDAAPAR